MLLISVLAFVVANVVAVLAAWVLGYVVEESVLGVVAGLLFIAVGMWMFMERGEELREFRGGLAACFLAIALAEMGDKTQLAVFTAALATGQPLYALAGGVVGYTIANAIGVLIARVLGDRVRWSRVKILASAVMVCIGLWLFVEALYGVLS